MAGDELAERRGYPELVAAISEVTGVLVTYRDLSSDKHSAALRAEGLDEQTISFLVQLDADLSHNVSAEVTGELRRLIGRPTTPLLEGLRARPLPSAARP